MPNQIADAFDRAALRQRAEEELARREKERVFAENADAATDDIIAWLDVALVNRRLRKQAIGFKNRRIADVDTGTGDAGERVCLVEAVVHP